MLYLFKVLIKDDDITYLNLTTAHKCIYYRLKYIVCVY